MTSVRAPPCSRARSSSPLQACISRSSIPGSAPSADRWRSPPSTASGSSSAPTTACSRSRSSAAAAPAEAVDLARSPARLEPVSATFHGRDIFAPVAAKLALGARLAELGESTDPSTLATIDRGRPVIQAGLRLEAEVGHVDAFGNLALIATAADADDAGLEVGQRLRVRGPRRSDQAVYALTFADAAPGDMVLLVDSARSLALAVNRGDAARQLDLEPGDRVLLTSTCDGFRRVPTCICAQPVRPTTARASSPRPGHPAGRSSRRTSRARGAAAAGGRGRRPRAARSSFRRCCARSSSSMCCCRCRCRSPSAPRSSR